MVFTGRVVSDICVGDVFNVPDHAVEDFGDFNVCVIVGWNNFATWAVLPLVIGDLPYVLGQLVDCQARPGVNGLTLNRATGGQYIRWPLPVVVGRASVELQVVDLIFAGLRQRGDGHVQT